MNKQRLKELITFMADAIACLTEHIKEEQNE